MAYCDSTKWSYYQVVYLKRGHHTNIAITTLKMTLTRCDRIESWTYTLLYINLCWSQSLLWKKLPYVRNISVVLNGRVIWRILSLLYRRPYDKNRILKYLLKSQYYDHYENYPIKTQTNERWWLHQTLHYSQPP